MWKTLSLPGAKGLPWKTRRSVSRLERQTTEWCWSADKKIAIDRQLQMDMDINRNWTAEHDNDDDEMLA